MKRDMELIRKLLIEIENGNLRPEMDGVERNAVNYHLGLMKQRGLIEAIVHYSKRGVEAMDVPDSVIVKSMTWEGHDFIEAISNDTKWTKVKSFLAESGKDLTIETIKIATGQLFGFGTPS